MWPDTSDWELMEAYPEACEPWEVLEEFLEWPGTSPTRPPSPSSPSPNTSVDGPWVSESPNTDLLRVSNEGSVLWVVDSLR